MLIDHQKRVYIGPEVQLCQVVSNCLVCLLYI